MRCQRTLLPYRLALARAAENILDELAWRQDNADIEALINAIAINPEGAWRERANLDASLCDWMQGDYAAFYIRDLLQAARAVWLFEREFTMSHGIALVRQEVAA